MQNNNIIGYKKAKNNILVILQIPYDAKHNIDRKYIIDKQYAKHRCSHAKVTDIIDLNNNTSIDKAYSLHDSNFIYELGQDVICDTFDTNLEKTYGQGIHFFLDKDRATLEQACLEHFNGEYKEWHNNGQLKIHTTYKDGNIDGEYKSWNDNGQLSIYSGIDGEFKSWYNDGQLHIHTYFQGHKGNKKHGEFKEWNDNGQLKIHTTYQNGDIHGEYKEWHDNGQLKIHTYYQNNKYHGEYKKWYDNGQLLIHATNKDGISIGEYKEWLKDGELQYHFTLKDCHIHGEYKE
jgi:antitoxin component YwqK of YwqJK toxin-antitoxin module